MCMLHAQMLMEKRQELTAELRTLDNNLKKVRVASGPPTFRIQPPPYPPTHTLIYLIA